MVFEAEAVFWFVIENFEKYTIMGGASKTPSPPNFLAEKKINFDRFLYNISYFFVMKSISK